MDSNNSSSNAYWTIMIYMAADDARGIPEAFKFLAELHELKWLHLDLDDNIIKKQNRNVHIVLQAYTDWSTDEGSDDFYARRFEIDPDFSLDKPKVDRIRQPMGDGKTLRDFIEWAKKEYTSEHYLLLLWGHGTGSSMFSLDLKNSFEGLTKKVPSFTIYKLNANDKLNPRERIKKIEDLVSEDSVYFTDKENTKSKKEIDLEICYTGKYDSIVSDFITLRRRKTKYYGDDKKNTVFDIVTKDNNKSLSYDSNRLRNYLFFQSNLEALKGSEIREALRSEENKVDILMIMGCCMQILEFAHEIKNTSSYLIASEELIYFDGYNYIDTFSNLHEFPWMDPRQLAKRIIQETPLKENYTVFERNSLAISCVDLDKSNEMVSSISDLAEKIIAITEKYPSFWRRIKKARKQCRHFGEGSYKYSFIDLIWFFKMLHQALEKDTEISGTEDGKELKHLIVKTSDNIQSKYIIQSWIGNKRTPRLIDKRSFGGHGVGIYFPESKADHKKNEDLGLFFVRDNANVNLFSEDNKWNDFIFKYMDINTDATNYPPEPENVNREERQKKMEVYYKNSNLQKRAVKLELLKHFLKLLPPAASLPKSSLMEPLPEPQKAIPKKSQKKMEFDNKN